MAISMLKIRRPLGRLIFNMGIAIPGKTVFLIETVPLWWGRGITTMTSHIVVSNQIKSALLAICVGNSPETGEFPAQRASHDEKLHPDALLPGDPFSDVF